MESDRTRGNPEKKPFLKRITGHRAFIPITIFIGVVLIFSFSSRFSERPPEIHSISPSIADAGDILVIKGDYFGDVRQGGEVSIAGVRPVSSSYYEWTDERISVQLPSAAGSGVVAVTTRTGRSNTVLFTNINDIPVVIEGPAKPGHPYVEAVAPRTGTVGELISITGMNFGEDRNAGKVYFSAIRSRLEGGSGYSGGDQEIRHIMAGDCDFDYENWTENEILVRVSDGATSGNLYVETDKGRSNSVYFEVLEPVGTKLLTTKRGYQVQYGVSLENVVSRGGNEMYIWMPKVLRTANQNNFENINSPDPYWDFSCQVYVYRFEDITTGETARISQTYWFDRYGLETKINTAAVVSEYTDRRLTQEYTKNTDDLPVDHETIQKIVQETVKWEKNPYGKARLLFNYLIETLEYTDYVPSASIIEALEFNKGNSRIYSFLYTTMLRAAGIPSRIKSGSIVYGDKETRQHFWNEFYLEDFGWVPVDPALADGARFKDFPFVEDPRTFYFGNIDNQHICTAKGPVHTIQIRPDNRLVRRNELFPMMNSHEELSPTIQSYRADWQEPRIIEWW
jgi:hypothetical protein